MAAKTARQSSVVTTFDPDDFANASIIASWLEAQPDEEKLQITQEVFTKLLQNAAQPRKSSSQACVKLCGFVQLCARSTHDGIRRWAFTRDTSMRLFDFYIEWNEHDQHRSMRLVLDVLTTAFSRNVDAEVGSAIKTTILETLVSIITRQSTRPLVKSSLHCVVHFLSKQAATLDDLSATYRRVNPDGRELPLLELWQSLVSIMFSWMELHYVCPIAGKFIVNVLTSLTTMATDGSHPELEGFGPKTWQRWIQAGLSADMERLESVKTYVLTPLFVADRRSSLEFLKIYNEESLETKDALSGDWALLRLAILEVGKKSGLVDEPGHTAIAQKEAVTVPLRSDVLESFLVHPTYSVRTSGLSLLVSSAATTKPISEETFILLRSHLAAYYADHDAKFRNETLAMTKDLINRVKYVIAMATRSLSKLDAKAQRKTGEPQPSTATEQKKKYPENLITDEKEARAVLERHTSFLGWYIEFIKGELIPTASYQRHIAGLKAFWPVLKLGKHASASDDALDTETARTIFRDNTCIRLLLDLLMDPFDDVRETAMEILLLVPQDIITASLSNGEQTLLKTLRLFCTRATNLASRTGRADHGNGAARAQGLLCSWLSAREAQLALVSSSLQTLENKLDKAKYDLGHAAVNDSVHGDFASLGYIWQILASADTKDDDPDPFSKLQRRIVKCCGNAWMIVRHVLCDDSPEGHLPEEMEDIEGLDTKDLLSYSFRAIHESSNVMKIIVNGLRTRGTSTAMLPPLDVFNAIGALTFDQLATLRHRGAFTTVSSTFTACCQITQVLRSVFPELPESENHLRRWWNGAVDCIMNQASTTRRSAGIPSLVIGILAANSDSPSFKEVFEDLVSIGKRPAKVTETDGSKLPQVHALNCLRGIFRSSLLSKKAESYLPATLELAADSLKSEVWAIRNCGLILLRSLIDCLLGTGESKHVTESGWDGHTIRISYAKYPTLPGVLVNLLKSAGSSITPGLGSSAAAEAVFPVLDIIRRAGPPDECRDELFGYIEEYLGSQIWHVRDVAARTVCSFLLQGDWVGTVEELLRSAGGSANRLHGALLTTRFIVERKLETDRDTLIGDLPKLISVLGQQAKLGGPFQTCEDVLTAYFEIWNLILKMNIVDSVNETQLEITEDSLLSISSALLREQLCIQGVYEARNRDDVSSLWVHLANALQADMDTACKMLEIIPEVWSSNKSKQVCYSLCNLYVQICQHIRDATVRTLALSNLKDLMDDVLAKGRSNAGLLPSSQSLRELWEDIEAEDINPGLSHATLAVSGSIIATFLARREPEIEHMLRTWGGMLADALGIDNTFDTRFAAAEALKSFCSSAGDLLTEAEHLPLLMALYDAINDDDDEVRDVAAAATVKVLGRSLAPLEAADRLLDHIASHFGDNPEFQNIVVCRLAGVSPRLKKWPDVKLTIKRAIDFDDSLFAEEEQNLFVDEVRELKRFHRVAEGLTWKSDDEYVRRLRDWVSAGLSTIVQPKFSDDGSLGLASDQHYFALCARLIVSRRVLARTTESVPDNDPSFASLFGHETLLHGSLARMATEKA
ncbi:putative death-receptor fusion protein-domain-containing protein [Coniochaeta sp. 2T2.1]|nr:putative death-receptor fusion protein-domain-containing protein [Coniochaeta sp. 2T2.1]